MLGISIDLRRCLRYRAVTRARKRRLKSGKGCRQRLCRYTAKFLLAMVFAYGISLVALPAGDHRLSSPVEIASRGFSYNLSSYELANLAAKWFHLLYSALPWTDLDAKARHAHLARYIELAPELRASQQRLDSAIAQNDTLAISVEQSRYGALKKELGQIRDSLEELLESTISGEIVKIGLHQWGDFIWPPVDIRLSQPPSIVVSSPRHVIRREEVKLLRPDLSDDMKTEIERALLESYDLSAVVLATGGLAAYPNIVASDSDLLPLLEVSAHEWLHAYLLFHPLGRAYWDNSDMLSLNETLADIAGDEIGRLAYVTLTGNEIETSVPPPNTAAAQVNRRQRPENEFDFREFMFETRARADEMLASGEIEAAEDYMEHRRLVLVERGYNIRKINQAYFAFHGLYAAGATSTSPLGEQLWELRQLSSDVGEFLKLLQSVGTWEEFLSVLDAHEIDR